MCGSACGRRILRNSRRPAGAGRACEVHHVAVGALEARDGRDDDGKEGEQEDQQQLRREPEAEPDDEQRGDRDLGDDLQEHDHRIDGLLHEARVGDGQRQRHAHHDRQRVAGQDLLGRHPGAAHHQVVPLPELRPDLRRGRQQVLLDAQRSYRDFPDHEQRGEDREGAGALAQPGGDRRAAGGARGCSGEGAGHGAHARSQGGGGAARSHVPNTAGTLISRTSRSSERPTTLCGTPAGCERPSRPAPPRRPPRRRSGR